MSGNDKTKQELRPLRFVGEHFRKIIVTKDYVKFKRDEDGIVTMGTMDFLLDENSLDRQSGLQKPQKTYCRSNHT